jgi:4-carboxymuconolactone decarboxylase
VIKRKQRIPMRDLETMTAEDRTTVEKNAMNGQVFNIFKVLAHHPALVKRWTSASRPCRSAIASS